MTLVYPTNGTDPCSTGARTHAFVIGVSDYPHLRDGSAFKNHRAKITMGLGQLTSPVTSAVKFADWLIDTPYNNPSAPLETVELLLSRDPVNNTPVQRTYRGRTIGSACMGDVKTAFDDWLVRCGRNADNVGLFYFCGHGIQTSGQLLLAEDFGASSVRPWENAIDIDTTYDGMADCLAGTQCYFLDSCRESSLDALSKGTIAPTALKTLTGNRLVREAPILNAAANGHKAHGLSGHVSFFTEALVDCLGKFATRSAPAVNGDWVVDTAQLRLAVKERMRRTRLPSTHSRAYCDTGGGDSNITKDLHRFAGVAQVMVDVVCSPERGLEYAHLEWKENGSGLSKGKRTPDADPWEVDLPKGKYDLEGRLESGAPYARLDPLPIAGYEVLPPWVPVQLRAL